MQTIRKYRKAMGMTQEKLAEKLGVTQGAVSQWETGEAHPAFEMLLRLADVLGVTVDALVRKDDA